MKRPFEQAVVEHGAVVLRVCRAVVGADEADDAWSETFLSALRAWPDLPDDANVRAWLVTIAHRKAVDVVRAGARHAVPVAQVPDATAPRGDQPEEALLDSDLWAALAALPDKQRLCVAYHHVAGLSHPEVARIVGGTAAAARRAAADGVARLRSTYAPEGRVSLHV